MTTAIIGFLVSALIFMLCMGIIKTTESPSEMPALTLFSLVVCMVSSVLSMAINGLWLGFLCFIMWTN